MMKLLPALLLAAALASREAPTWESAGRLMARSDYRGAAQAYELFRAADPDGPRATEALVEAGVCWFSGGRSKLELRRVTDGARESFDRSLERNDAVTREHAKSSLSSRAQYMKGSVHLFAGE